MSINDAHNFLLYIYISSRLNDLTSVSQIEALFENLFVPLVMNIVDIYKSIRTLKIHARKEEKSNSCDTIVLLAWSKN